MALAEALVVTMVEIIVAAAAKRRERKMIAAAVEEITTTMDADAEMETIMDSLADLGGYSY